VKTPGKVTFVELDQIQAIEAAGKYAVVHVGKENHVLRETMSSLESHLPPQRFLRISRSVIVNMDQIQELQPMFKDENLVVLKNGKSYPTAVEMSSFIAAASCSRARRRASERTALAARW
jgi:two-component system LytT family response regulator